jgi:hypothetical protein
MAVSGFFQFVLSSVSLLAATGCDFDFWGFYWTQLIVISAIGMTARSAFNAIPRPEEPAVEKILPTQRPTGP